MNHANLIGNLTKDPESRTVGSGIQVTGFTVAVSRRGESKEADFIPVVTWRASAVACARYLHKGSKVAVVGRIQTRSYDAQDGTKRYVTEVVADEVEFLDTKGSAEQPAPAPAPERVQEPVQQLQQVDDGDLPF